MKINFKQPLIILLLGITATVVAAEVSLENANWTIFSNRSHVQALALSKETLWVGTAGGLEQWDTETQQLQRVFQNVDGLPNNFIKTVLVDSHEVVWVGTHGGGLGCRQATGNQWNVFPDPNMINTLLADDNGNLWLGTYGGLFRRSTDCGEWKPDFHQELSEVGYVNALLIDEQGRLWAGTDKGLARRDAEGEWTFFNHEHGNYPDLSDSITALETDGQGGLWIGTGWDDQFARGLAQFTANGEWFIYNTDNSKLPSNSVYSLLKDEKGGLWVGTEEGLVYRDVNNKWVIGYDKSSGLPASGINALISDSKGGLWAGTSHYTGHGGLAHFDSQKWTVLTSSETFGVPSNNFFTLLADDKGGLWVGSGVIAGDPNGLGGLGYYSASGKWTVYTPENSRIPGRKIHHLVFDGPDALWMGTEGDGLAHFNITQNKWEIFNTSNQLPDNNVLSLARDNDGLWIGTMKGLAYRSINNEWKNFDSSHPRLENAPINELLIEAEGGLWIGIGDPYDGNSEKTGLLHRSVNGEWTDYSNQLPNDSILALASDGENGLWIGTRDGLVHRSANNQWEVWTVENAKLPLPGDMITAITPDNHGGLWIGIAWRGLAYRSSSDNWTFFDSQNSGLPTNFIQDFALNDGLWIGGSGGGLIHLNFGQKEALCTQVDCDALLTSQRAAIIIAGGGNDKSNTLWETSAAISDQIYKMLNKRGFDNDEIYYLSPQSHADFNGDGMDDCIVDAPATPRCKINSVANPIEERPLTVSDVRQALEDAKGQLDQPLYVFFNDHGGTDKLQLAKGSYLNVLEFKAILDDYQQTTGNELVLVIDTCYSGVLLEKLIAPNRAIISSTGNGLAYYDRRDKQGFSRFLADGLLKGMNFLEAFDYASDKQTKLVKSLNIGQDQIPQSYDGKNGEWLRDLYVNGSFVTGDTTLAVKELTPPTTLSASQTLTLQARVSLAQGTVKRVWAVLKPPRVSLVMDSNGTPILAFPRLSLSPTDDEGIWETTWRDAVYNGEYEITIYAEDNQGNIANSDPINISVIGTGDSPSAANVQIVLEKDNYHRGETFKAELIENLGWGYDLYAAVVLQDGNFFAFKNTNNFAALNLAAKWEGQRRQNSPLTLLELTLPTNLATGEYCLYGILSPERENVLETLNLWVWTLACFEII
jgi:ligand-binding sensor domain-containing protein